MIKELVRYAYRFTLNVHDAEDLVQDCFVKFYSNEDYMIREGKYKIATLKLMIKSVFIRNIRRDSRRAIIFRCAMGGCKDRVQPENNIDYKALQMFMKERNDKQINIFHLHNIGYSATEIQGIFNMKLSSIHNCIYYGKNKLRKYLKAA